eukprot:m51a1_g7941 putative translin (232) ;mRNA; r:111612-112457
MAGVMEELERHARELEADTQLRDEIKRHVRDAEQSLRPLALALAPLHARGLGDAPAVATCAARAGAALTSAGACLARVRAAVPAGQYWRHRELWRQALAQAVQAAAVVTWVTSGRLVGREGVEAMLGLRAEADGAGPISFPIDVEDYLSGLCGVPAELSRLAVNCVTHGDYASPGRIAAFVTELHDGFRMLNLKNDFLRKRFDGIKYDVKKIEEVMYDLSVRGLNKDAVQP